MPLNIADKQELGRKAKLHPLISLIFVFTVVSLVAIPHYQISGLKNNTTEQAKQENQDLTTLAQIFGGVAIGIGIYCTWRRISIADYNLKLLKAA